MCGSCVVCVCGSCVWLVCVARVCGSCMWLVCMARMCGSCVTRAFDYNPIKMRGLKYLRQEMSQDFSTFSVLIPASGGSLSPGSSSKRPLSNKLY